MINQSHQPLDRGQPYQEMGAIELDDHTFKNAPDLDIDIMLAQLGEFAVVRDEQHRIFDGALMLYEKLCSDTAYEGITRPDLFAACLHTGLIWERG